MNIVKEINLRQNGYSQNKVNNIACLPLSKLKCFYTSNSNIASDTAVYVTKFNPNQNYQNILAIGTEDGKLIITDHEVPPNRRECLAHPNAIYDIAWAPGHPSNLITVSGDHRATIWDVGNSDIVFQNNFSMHTRSIKTVSYNPTNYKLFATGGRDNVICIWDLRCQNGTPTQITSCHSFSTHKSKKKQESQYTSITGIEYIDDNLLVSCGAGDGVIKIWDIRKYYTTSKKSCTPYKLFYHSKSTKNGFTCLKIDPAKTTIFASCIDSHIYAYNIGKDKSLPVFCYYGHEANNYFIKIALSPDGKFIISGSTLDNACIWNTNTPGQPIIQLPTNKSLEYNSVDWSNHYDPLIVTSSYYFYEYSLWKILPKMDHLPSAIVMNENQTNKLIPNQFLNFHEIDIKPSTSKIGMSPTLNLPNSVIDGSNIRHICNKRKRPADNWLTALSNKKIKSEEQTPNERRKFQPRSGTNKNQTLLKFLKK